MDLVSGVIGGAGLIAIAWLLSQKKGSFPIKIVIVGLSIQCFFLVTAIYVPFVGDVLMAFNNLVTSLHRATLAGTGFLFGYLGGGETPFAITHGENMLVMAFGLLPMVIVVGALSSLLFHWGVLQLIIKGLAKVFSRVFGLGGATSFAVGANIFFGMVESPLLIRNYLKNMSSSDLFLVMTAGMATVSSNMIAIYGSLIQKTVAEGPSHILVASVLSGPAAVVVARVMMPNTESGSVDEVTLEKSERTLYEVVYDGGIEGAKVFGNIVLMILLLFAGVSFLNQALELLPEVAGAPLTLERMGSWVMVPLSQLMGLSQQEANVVGELLSIKTVLNEYVAYEKFNEMAASLSPRVQLIAVYAMCGFANVGSLGIMVGGLNSMIPDRRREVLRLGLFSMISGTLATMLTGTLVGIFY